MACAPRWISSTASARHTLVDFSCAGPVRAQDAAYVPAYLMAAQTLKMASRLDDAREWVRAGVEAARKKGDDHALSELESFAAELGA